MGRPKKQAKGAEGPTPTESYKELLKPPYLDQVESHFKGVSEIIPGGNKTKYSELFRRFFLNKNHNQFSVRVIVCIRWKPRRLHPFRQRKLA